MPARKITKDASDILQCNGNIATINGEVFDIKSPFSRTVFFDNGKHYEQLKNNVAKAITALDFIYTSVNLQLELDYSKAKPNVYSDYNTTAKEWEENTSKKISFFKGEKTEEINSDCKKKIISGFPSSALNSIHLYESEEEDQINLVGMKDRGVDLPLKCSADNGLTWEWKPHTPAQLKTVFDDGVDFKLTQLQKCASLKAQINAIDPASQTAIADINAITWGV